MSMTIPASILGRRRPGEARGFTLVEILIVVVILGILAAIVIPQFSNASQTSRENTLKDELRYLRTQIIVYKAQHRDAPPGYPGGNTGVAATQADFIAQMTQFTDEYGNTSATSTSVFKFGPYLTKMPSNPVSTLSTINTVANGAALPPADNSTGWIYQPQTQIFLPNQTGNDTNGVPYSSY